MLYRLFLCSHVKCAALLPLQTKNQLLEVKGERSWNTETLKARWLPLRSWRQEQHLQRHQQPTTVAQKDRCNCSCLFANHFKWMARGTWHMNWFLVLLGRPIFLSSAGSRPKIAIFFMDHNEFYLNVLLPLIFSLTFMLHFLRGQTRAIQVQILLCWCCLSMTACPTKPARIRFPYISHLLQYTTTDITPCCHITPFCCLITQFVWHIIENLHYIAKKTPYSKTQERVKRLYNISIYTLKAI